MAGRLKVWFYGFKITDNQIRFDQITGKPKKKKKKLGYLALEYGTPEVNGEVF